MLTWHRSGAFIVTGRSHGQEGPYLAPSRSWYRVPRWLHRVTPVMLEVPAVASPTKIPRAMTVPAEN